MHVHLCDGGGCVRGLDTSIHKSSSPLLFSTMEENHFYGAFHAYVYIKYSLQCLIITRNFQYSKVVSVNMCLLYGNQLFPGDFFPKAPWVFRALK